MRSDTNTSVTTSVGHRSKKPNGGEASTPLHAAILNFQGVYSDHPVMLIETANEKKALFLNIWGPETPISLAVLAQQIEKMPPEEAQKHTLRELTKKDKETHSPHLVQETDPEQMKARMFAIGTLLGTALKEEASIFLQEMPNLNNTYFEEYFDALMDGIKAGANLDHDEAMMVVDELKRNFIPTDGGDTNKDKFGLSCASLNNKLELTSKTDLNPAVAAVKSGKVSKAAVYEMDGQLYVNAHMDWNKPVESAKLIKTAVEQGAIFGGDTNIQLLTDAKLPAFSIGEATYEREHRELLTQRDTLKDLEYISPDEEQRRGIKDINDQIRALELQYAHSILQKLQDERKATLTRAGNTLDVVAAAELTETKITEPLIIITPPAPKVSVAKNPHATFQVPKASDDTQPTLGSAPK